MQNGQYSATICDATLTIYNTGNINTLSNWFMSVTVGSQTTVYPIDLSQSTVIPFNLIFDNVVIPCGGGITVPIQIFQAPYDSCCGFLPPILYVTASAVDTFPPGCAISPIVWTLTYDPKTLAWHPPASIVTGDGISHFNGLGILWSSPACFSGCPGGFPSYYYEMTVLFYPQIGDCAKAPDTSPLVELFSCNPFIGEIVVNTPGVNFTPPLSNQCAGWLLIITQ